MVDGVSPLAPVLYSFPYTARHLADKVLHAQERDYSEVFL